MPGYRINLLAFPTAYGSPDVLHLMEVAKPIPKDNEVLIKIHATTVNRTDCGFRTATPFIVRFFSGLFKPKFTILGSELAGEIEAVGSAVSLFKKGDQVFGLSAATFGTHAEYICLPETGSIAIKPITMPCEEAAAVCDGAFLALNVLRQFDIQPGQKILINGATGSIGTADPHWLWLFSGDAPDGMSSEGYRVEIRFFPQGDYTQFAGIGQKPVAHVRLVKQTIKADPLFAYMTVRRTNRLAYEGPLVRSSEFARWVSAAQPAQATARLINEPDQLTQHLDLLIGAIRVETLNYARHEESRIWFRESDQQIAHHRDGLCLPANPRVFYLHFSRLMLFSDTTDIALGLRTTYPR